MGEPNKEDAISTGSIGIAETRARVPSEPTKPDPTNPATWAGNKAKFDEKVSLKAMLNSPNNLKSSRFRRVLLEKVGPEKVVAGILECLEATYVGRDGKERPDFRIRAPLLQWLYELEEGKTPVRQENVNINVDVDPESVADRLATIPGAREALRRAIGIAEKPVQSHSTEKRTTMEPAGNAGVAQ